MSTFRCRIVVALLMMLGAASFCSCCQAQDKLLTQRVQVRYRGRSYECELPGNGTILSCMAVADRAKPEGEQATLMFSSTRRWGGKGEESKVQKLADPGDRVVFIDTVTGIAEIASNLQPGPTEVAVSPDGLYVAFASHTGWPNLDPRWADDPGHALLKPTDNAKGTTKPVGTIACSVWGLKPLRLEWELRLAAGLSKEDVAEFKRPWNNGAILTIPWWQADLHCEFIHTQLTFSPDSKYLVALDHHSGVRVLKVADGRQFVRCVGRAGSRPVSVMFPEANLLDILTSDGTLRQYAIDAGRLNSSRMLPIPLKVSTDEPHYFRPDFGVSCGRDLIVRADTHLRFATNLKSTKNHEFTMPLKKNPQGHALIPCHFELSGDGRRLGIGYHYVADDIGSRFSRFSNFISFEIWDVPSQMLVRRAIVPGSDLDLPAEEAPTIKIESDFTACMDTDGEEIIYAHRLKRP